MKLTAQIERSNVVNARVFNVISQAQAQQTIEAAYALVKKELNPNYWLVGKGGHHVWIKRADKPSVRVAIVSEAVVKRLSDK